MNSDFTFEKNTLLDPSMFFKLTAATDFVKYFLQLLSEEISWNWHETSQFTYSWIRNIPHGHVEINSFEFVQTIQFL